MTGSTRIGFVGLGLMGRPMAGNVARAGFPLTVWNRTAEKAEPLRSLGAAVGRSAAEVAAGADVLVTMVSDDAALHDRGHQDDDVMVVVHAVRGTAS
jgi:3-hydroxyisobutyrate dehydrogenase